MAIKFLTPEQLTARDAALITLLKSESLTNESGEQWTKFEIKNRDRQDFGSIGILQLQRLMNKAYMAGFEAAKQRKSRSA